MYFETRNRRVKIQKSVSSLDKPSNLLHLLTYMFLFFSRATSRKARSSATFHSRWRRFTGEYMMYQYVYDVLIKQLHWEVFWMAVLHYLIEFQDFLHCTRFDKYKGFTQNYSIFINGEGWGWVRFQQICLYIMIQRDFTITGM